MMIIKNGVQKIKIIFDILFLSLLLLSNLFAQNIEDLPLINLNELEPTYEDEVLDQNIENDLNDKSFIGYIYPHGYCYEGAVDSPHIITKNIKKKKGETATMNPKLDTSSSKDKAGEMEAKESKDLDATNAAKAIKHDCATHVEHATWGAGKCIPGEHTIVETSEGEGYVTHYDVMFEHGLERDVPVEEMKIIKSSSHGHMRKKKSEQKEEQGHFMYIDCKKFR